MLDATTEGGARAEWRLREEEVAWLTTVRPDGQPQSVPIWFLWDGEGAHGGGVVRTEGKAEIVEDVPPATEVGEYLEKYRAAITRIGYDPDGFARDYSVSIRVTPECWQVW